MGRFRSQAMAIRSAREILADAIRSGENRIPEALLITDEEGRAIETIPFASVLPESLKK
jgi:Mg-chelatase subunit ChlD